MNNPIEFDRTLNSSCPAHAPQIKHRLLSGGDELVFPLHKRVIVQYSNDEAGMRELHLYYGDKEISFEEPELFAFGETLAKQAGFTAKTATSWGAGYPWLQVKELLEHLLDEGILHYADSFAGEQTPERNGHCPSPLPKAQTTTPRSWVESEAITRELTGRKLELAYLELVIPVFRIAHIAMDTEGRQVGEANVFPQALRLDVETEWRTCPYSGSRYLDERPMNVTALRSMSAYWPQMMEALLRIRNAYLQRFPDARHGWTVGGIEALATLVLAVPTYQLMRTQHPVENGQLHPALASMFRVTDGLRMVTHQMIFVPVGEPTLPAATPMTAGEIYDYSERNHAFSSAQGVCAGPKVMVEEFLNVLLNGVPAKDSNATPLDAPVLAALEEIEQAFDYGLYGLQAHAAVFSIWPAMTRCYAQLADIVQAWSGDMPEPLLDFKERLQAHLAVLNTQTHHASEAWRRQREQAYADIYRHCAQGLRERTDHKSLFERLAPVFETRHRPARDQLRTVLQAFCAEGNTVNGDVDNLLNCLMNFFLQVQAILKLAGGIQQRINGLLGRAEPLQAFDAKQIDIHNLLQASDNRRLPFILDELEDVLNIRISITKDTIEIAANIAD